MRKLIVFAAACTAAYLAFKFVFEHGERVTENLWAKMRSVFGEV